MKIKKLKTELKEIKNENQNLKNSICDLLKKEEKKIIIWMKNSLILQLLKIMMKKN